MRIAATTIALCLALTIGNAFAVQVETYSTSSKDVKDVALVESESPFSFEFHAEATYAGDGDVQRGERGNLRIQDFDEGNARVHFILTPMTRIGVLRLGIQTERYSFGYGNLAPIPNDLHSTALVLGLDTEFSDSFLIRLELDPGFYGTDFDDFGQDTFNVPVIIGGTYIYSSNFQIVFGIGVDALRKYPVLPGGGARSSHNGVTRNVGRESCGEVQTGRTQPRNSGGTTTVQCFAERLWLPGEMLIR